MAEIRDVGLPKWAILLGRLAGYGVVFVVAEVFFLTYQGATSPNERARAVYALAISKKTIYVSAIEYAVFIASAALTFLSVLLFLLIYFARYFETKPDSE